MAMVYEEDDGTENLKIIFISMSLKQNRGCQKHHSSSFKKFSRLKIEGKMVLMTSICDRQ